MHLIPLMYFYCDILMYMFQPVVLLSSGWHFCYNFNFWHIQSICYFILYLFILSFYGKS